jgi:hypothetical protein
MIVHRRLLKERGSLGANELAEVHGDSHLEYGLPRTIDLPEPQNRTAAAQLGAPLWGIAQSNQVFDHLADVRFLLRDQQYATRADVLVWAGSVTQSLSQNVIRAGTCRSNRRCRLRSML